MFFKFEGTLADLPPTCMWTFLINTFWFFHRSVCPEKKGRERERDETRHPGRVGIRSKVWHAAQGDHRYSIAFSLSPHQHPSSLLLQSLTHSHAPCSASATSVAHSPLCLFCAGVATSLNNAVVCLFFRREEGHNALIGKTVFHSHSMATYMDDTCENTQSCLSHSYMQTTGVYVRLCIIPVSQLDIFIVCAFPSKTKKLFSLSLIQLLYQIQKYFE